VKLTTQLHQAPTLRMFERVNPFPPASACLIRDRDSLTPFLFLASVSEGQSRAELHRVQQDSLHTWL